MGHQNTRRGPHAHGALSPREQEILSLLAAGKSPPEIAECLGVANGTAAAYVRAVYRKIGAKPDGYEGIALTERELQILAFLAAGDSTPDIAAQLGIKPGTVKTHLTSIYRKIGAKNRVQAARYYLDHYGGED